MQGNLYPLKYLKGFRNSTVWIQRTKTIPIIGQRYVAYIIIQKAETGDAAETSYNSMFWLGRLRCVAGLLLELLKDSLEIQ